MPSSSRSASSSRPITKARVAAHHNYDYDYPSAPLPPLAHRATLASSSVASHANISASSSTSRPHYHAASSAPTYSHRTILLDPFLEYHLQSQDSLLEYDVALPTSQARRGSSSSGDTHTLSSRDRARPATTPPLPYLRLTCALLPWPIDICPTSDHGYVTVGDVLEGIHRALRQHISKPEWVATGEPTRRAVQQAFYRRVGRSQCHREWKEECASGLRRIDWVGKKTLFAGLTRRRSGRTGREAGPEEWMLLLRLPEKSVKFWAES